MDPVQHVSIPLSTYNELCRDRDLLTRLDTLVRERTSPHNQHLVLHEDWEDGIWFALKDCSWPATTPIEDKGPHRNVRAAIEAAVCAKPFKRTPTHY